jgi:signal transduction histidine kinase/ActR/RegA family two-component response regulator
VDSGSLRAPALLSIGALILLACLLVFFVVDSSAQQRSGALAIRFAEQVIGDLRSLEARVADAESGQRGYLLTGDAGYLVPYDAAPAASRQLLLRLHQALSSPLGDGSELERLNETSDLVASKLTELRRAVELQQSGRTEEALALVRSNAGLAVTDKLRADIATIVTHEGLWLDHWLDGRQRDQNLATGVAAAGGVFALLMMLAACVLAAFFARASAAVRAALQSARDAAVSADRAKSQFLATASHDLRQPLHAMNLFISALRRRVSGDEAVKLVANMASAAESMQMMFNSLLDVSKLNAGVVEPSPRDFPVEEVFARLRNVFSGSAADKGLALEIEPGSCVLHTDPALLESILRNLISNAVRYTRQGEVTVQCRQSGNIASIEVSDTGPGIPNDQIERAFQEFQRLDTSNAAERGLGLGLAIVRRLARLLDLQIQIESVVGVGTSFVVHVPAVPEQLSASHPENRYDPSLAGKRILLVDDDPLVREGLAREIADWGARVTLVGSVDGALWAMGDARPDIAIVDRDLGPNASGVDLLALLNASFDRTIPAVIVTGATDSAALDELRRSGAAWLIKPIDPAVLRAKVSELLLEARELAATD